MRNDTGLFIRKMDNVDRNFIKLNELKEHFNVPKIYTWEDNVLDMEYINGLDKKSYLAVIRLQKTFSLIISMLFMECLRH